MKALELLNNGWSKGSHHVGYFWSKGLYKKCFWYGVSTYVYKETQELFEIRLALKIMVLWYVSDNSLFVPCSLVISVMNSEVSGFVEF